MGQETIVPGQHARVHGGKATLRGEKSVVHDEKAAVRGEKAITIMVGRGTMAWAEKSWCTVGRETMVFNEPFAKIIHCNFVPFSKHFFV